MAQHLLKTFGIFKSVKNITALRFVRPYAVSTPPTNIVKNEIEDDIVDFDDSLMLPIPTYTMKQNETLQIKKARLLYQSRKRGMLENGLLLSTFAAKYLKGLTPEQTDLYDKLINLPSNDWDIYYWATGVKPTPEEYENEIMTMFRGHVKNSEKEKRYSQPDI